MSDESWTETVTRRVRKLELPTTGVVLAAALNTIAAEHRTVNGMDLTPGPGILELVTADVQDGDLLLGYVIERSMSPDPPGSDHEPE